MKHLNEYCMHCDTVIELIVIKHLTVQNNLNWPSTCKLYSLVLYGNVQYNSHDSVSISLI